jgi:hypothetical protein
VLAFAWPSGRIQPRDLPVGIIGSTPGSQAVIDRLSAADPAGFDFRLYADDARARAAIADRQVYGALAVTPGQVQVFEASAASPAVAQLLRTLGERVVGAAAQPGSGRDQSPVRLTTRDVVPLSAADPNGVVFSASLLPLTICSVIIAAAVGVLVKFRPAWRQVVALTVVSAVAAAGAYLISQTFLGALPEDGAADWASMALTVLAMSAATAGFIALIGVVGLGIAAVLMVFIGNPFSGVTSAPQLLPQAVDHIGQWLPPGAGANLLRSTAYFHGHGAAGHLTILITWIAIGFAAIVLGHHAPVRFAAHAAGRPPATASRPDDHLGAPDMTPRPESSPRTSHANGSAAALRTTQP